MFYLEGYMYVDSYSRAKDLAELLKVTVRQDKRVLYVPDVGETALAKFLVSRGEI